MKIAIFLVFILLFVVSGSFLTAFLFLRYGDGFEYKDKSGDKK